MLDISKNDIINQMLKNGVWVRIFLITIVLSLLPISPGGVKVTAEAPNTQISKLNTKKIVWTKAMVKNEIDLICEQEHFNYPTLMKWIASKESSFRVSVYGDSGESYGLYQYKEETWKEFQNEFNRPYLKRNNPADQIEMTIIALRNGKWRHWTTLTKRFKGNPI